MGAIASPVVRGFGGSQRAQDVALLTGSFGEAAVGGAFGLPRTVGPASPPPLVRRAPQSGGRGIGNAGNLTIVGTPPLLTLSRRVRGVAQTAAEGVAGGLRIAGNTVIELGHIASLGYFGDTPIVQRALIEQGALFNGVWNAVTSPRETTTNAIEAIANNYKRAEALGAQGQRIAAATINASQSSAIASAVLGGVQSIRSVSSMGAAGLRSTGVADWQFVAENVPASSLGRRQTGASGVSLEGMGGGNTANSMAAHPNYVGDLPFSYKAAPFQRFVQRFGDEFSAAGFDDAQGFMQGSAASGVKHSTGEALDARMGILPSDYDVAVVSPKLAQRAQELGLNVFNGPLSASEVGALGLTNAQNSLSAASKYQLPVNFKIYDSAQAVFDAQKTIPFNDWMK